MTPPYYRLLFALLLCCFGLSLSAQGSVLRVEPARVKKEVEVNLLDREYEEISTVNITNTSGRPLRLRWDRQVVESPIRLANLGVRQERDLPALHQQ